MVKSLQAGLNTIFSLIFNLFFHEIYSYTMSSLNGFCNLILYFFCLYYLLISNDNLISNITSVMPATKVLLFKNESKLNRISNILYKSLFMEYLLAHLRFQYITLCLRGFFQIYWKYKYHLQLLWSQVKSIKIIQASAV